MITLEAMPGEHVSDVAQKMVDLAKSRGGGQVTTDFNGITLVATADSCPATIAHNYSVECNRRHEAYINSDEYKHRQREAQEKQRQQELLLQGALSVAPEHMTLRDPDGWRQAVEANTDGYGSAVIRYAERWARLMESRLAGGSTIAESAEEMSHLADNEGITGFMYGCAVSILSRVWIRGEELRQWHNIHTQLGTEGEKANASGGVLNPAVLSIG
jgi:hypothetical protein